MMKSMSHIKAGQCLNFFMLFVYQIVEKEVFPRLVKNIQMQGARNNEE
jgi:hypothetical protein